MKSKKDSKKNSNHSGFEKNDSDSLKGKSVKKDKGSKRRLSIYDEFDDEPFEDDEYDIEEFDEQDEDDEDDDEYDD